MTILGRDDAGHLVAVQSLDEIEQIDWTLDRTGEYVYEFALATGASVSIRGPHLSPAGRAAVAHAQGEYDS